jgi:predicted nucleotidyltransferase
MGTIGPIMGSKGDKMNEQFIETIASALFGKTRRTILALLFTHADEEYYKREIIRYVTAGRGSVDRELKNLESAGIIRKFKRGRELYYSANPQCPVFDELKGLIVKTAGVVDVIREALQPLAGKIELAFVYGSVARGTEDKKSDIDILIVGDVTLREVVSNTSELINRLKRSVNPRIFGLDEFKTRLNEKDSFISRVFHGDKIILVGDASEFG